jgi:hypothetical protein
MDARSEWVDARSHSERPARTGRAGPGPPGLLSPRAAVVVITLLSLGLWSAIWLAATYVASARLW